MSLRKKKVLFLIFSFIYLSFLHRNLVSSPMLSLLPLVRNLWLETMLFLLHNRADLWYLKTKVFFSPFLLAAIMRVWQDEEGSCNWWRKAWRRVLKMRCTSGCQIGSTSVGQISIVSRSREVILPLYSTICGLLVSAPVPVYSIILFSLKWDTITVVWLITRFLLIHRICSHACSLNIESHDLL